ncbi:MAG: pyrroline-5-carboxylate reductase [Deltaproteobacteria bacterium]|nr:pyrroline-5-carboxylate reductase [Deltaproteobacteria bacterium]
MQQKKIGFIGGGNMAAALIRGLLHGGAFLSPQSVIVSDPSKARLDLLHGEHNGIGVTTSNAEVCAFADVVVLAVKPQIVDKVLGQITHSFREGSLLVSVAAGVSTAAIEAKMPPRTRVIRTMPNTAATVLAGATAISRGSHATDEDVELAEQLFGLVGRTVVLDETLIDAVTGLSGSGPAYLMLIIEALADGGVKVGLSRDTALMLAAQTVYGSAKLLLDTGEHPGRLKDMVTSPGGTAIAGLHTLEAGGLRTTLINAVEAATHRAQELGEAMDRKLRG